MCQTHQGSWSAALILNTVVTLLLPVSGYAKGDWKLFPLGDTHHVSKLSDKPTRFLTKGDIPDRPRLLLELGDPFLDTGNLGAGFELPTGAVWQPRLWVFATLRSAVQTQEDRQSPINPTGERITEWVNRLDLFANLQLTGTEKLIIGIRPFDKNRPGQFTRYTFEPNNNDGFRSELNADVRTFFFEGDLGSLFPNLDPQGQTWLDFGFAVGRQPIQFQENILINDFVDSVGIVRNNIRLPGISDLRVTALYGWDELDRNDGRTNPQSDMFGLFLSADQSKNTWNLDFIYVDDSLPNGQGDAFYVGFVSIQRLGLLNTNFRVNSSFAQNTDTAQVGDGTLFSIELAWTPYTSDDIIYLNTFWAIDNFTQAGREPIVGGPLGTFGILFASPNIGSFASELISFSNDVAGGALGYQAFWDNHRRHVVLEFGARKDTSGDGLDDYGFGMQFQQAFGRRCVLQLDAYYALQESRADATGLRMEILIQF